MPGLYAESEKRARVMTALIDNAIAINSSLHLNEVLQRLLEHTKEALQVRSGGFRHGGFDRESESRSEPPPGKTQLN